MSNRQTHHPLQLCITPGYEAISSHHPTNIPLLLEVKSNPDAPQMRARPPVTLGLCIDNSGSMDGEPLYLVKRAVSLVLQQLQPGDRVGLVSFSDVARVWKAPSHLNDRHRDYLSKSLDALAVEGSTAMHDGLLTTLQHMPRLRPDEVSHVWLLTDGYPNIGPSTAHELSAMVKEWRRHSVVSTFGFGSHHNEDLLQEVAAAGGGRYTLIDTVQSIPTAFAMALGALFDTIAKDVRLLMRPSERCHIERLYGDNELRYSARGLEVQLSDWTVGQSLSLLVDMSVTPESKWSSELSCGEFWLEYYLPEEEAPICTKVPLTLATSPDFVDGAQALHPMIARQQLLLRAVDAWQAARKLADQGLYMEAIHALEPCMIELQAHPDWHDEASDVRDWYEQFVEERDLYVQRPDQQWYQDFRKQAVAEMALPGQAVGGTAAATRFAASASQRQMIEQFCPEGEHKAVLELWERDQFHKTIPLSHEVTIGRVKGNDIVLPKGNVSKRHARIQPTNEGFILVDLRSSNGLYLNGKKLSGPQRLKGGDQIFVGDFRLSFCEGQTA